MEGISEIIQERRDATKIVLQKAIELLCKTDPIIDYFKDDIIELGSGSKGVAYKIGALVYKVTEDRSEYSTSKRLIGVETKYINKIHKCFIVNYKTKVYYIIVQDYVQPLTDIKMFDNLWGKIDELAGEGISIVEHHYNNNIIAKWESILSYNDLLKPYRTIPNKPTYNKYDIFITFLPMFEEMCNNNFRTTDACYKNLGVKDNHLVIFDLGYSEEYIDHDDEDLLFLNHD